MVIRRLPPNEKYKIAEFGTILQIWNLEFWNFGVKNHSKNWIFLEKLQNYKNFEKKNAILRWQVHPPNGRPGGRWHGRAWPGATCGPGREGPGPPQGGPIRPARRPSQSMGRHTCRRWRTGLAPSLGAAAPSLDAAARSESALALWHWGVAGMRLRSQVSVRQRRQQTSPTQLITN